MQRRHFVLASVTLPFGPLAQAHHGWSSFDQDRPVYLEGTARKVTWQNPHTELQLELAPVLKIPADLPTRPLPPHWPY
jgi:Family of unknown function (DUF6152)